MIVNNFKTLKPFIKAASLMVKYNSDCWWTDTTTCPNVSEHHYMALDPHEHPIAKLLIQEYEKVKGRPYQTPKSRKHLQAIAMEILG